MDRIILVTSNSNLKDMDFGERRLAVVGAVVVLCTWCIAVAGQQASPQPVNAFCPVMTLEEVNPVYTTEFEGRVIGFCCEKCLVKFEANPDRYAERLRAIESNPPPAGPDQADNKSGANHAHGDHTGNDITLEKAHDHDSAEKEHANGAKDTHEHAQGHTQGTAFFTRLIGWLGKFHPPMVNFPIAMILGAALAEVLLLATRQSFFRNAGRFCLWVGCVGAVLAAVLGWLFGGFRLVDESWILTTHRWIGTTTAAWSILLLVIGERTYYRSAATRSSYRFVLLVGATLVGVTGYFGGSLVYGVNHFAF